jgi:hypothetical protein
MFYFPGEGILGPIFLILFPPIRPIPPGCWATITLKRQGQNA